jgi:hypothetical protein
MDFVYNLVVVLHLLGMAALVGGWAAFARKGLDTVELMSIGARAQVVTGLVLVAMAEGISSLDKELDHPKIGVKLVVAIAAAACIEIARGRAKRGGPLNRGLVMASGALGVVNVAVAALWS